MAERVECTDLIAYDSEGKEVLRFHPNSGWLRIGPAAVSSTPEGIPLPEIAPGWGSLTIRDCEGHDAVVLKDASVDIGRGGRDGCLTIIDSEGRQIARITGFNATLCLGAGGQPGTILLQDSQERDVVQLDGEEASLTLGAYPPGDGDGNEGSIALRDNLGHDVILLNGGTATLSVGYATGAGVHSQAVGNAGEILVRDLQGRDTIRLNGERAALYVGAHNNEGDIIVYDHEGREVFKVDGREAALFVGADGNEGDIIVLDGDGREVFKVDGAESALYIGTSGNEGDIIVRDGFAREVFKVDGREAALFVGADGNEGDIIVLDGDGREVFKVDGAESALYIGTSGHQGRVIVRDGGGNERIRLDGETGDIRLRGADCAEEFDVADGEIVETGTVLVIDDNGTLRPCARAYDRCVAGVVSGASGLTPGIVLGNDPARNGRLPIALSGKVYCKVDAQPAPIRVGDLLTTSDVPGHAMKAQDAGLAFGAVIGKALRNQETGRGLIPILVSLQ